MSRPKNEINPISLERFKTILEEQHITQSDLSEKIGITQQSISAIATGKNRLTEPFAKKLNKEYPQYSVGWILGYSESRICPILSIGADAYKRCIQESCMMWDKEKNCCGLRN